MNEIFIRTATAADLDVLYTFEQGVITAERPFDGTLKPGHINYYDLQQMLESDHVELAVAELNGELIASGYARIEDAEPRFEHKKHAFLGFMFVDPAHRGKGVNRLIMDHLKNWATQRGVFEFKLNVYAENASAIRAYEKIGFSKYMIEMRFGVNDE